MNGFPTTNGWVRSRAILRCTHPGECLMENLHTVDSYEVHYRTFQHYRIKKLIFMELRQIVFTDRFIWVPKPGKPCL